MEYTNYKTGKPCSREQYIQNGLERGELLYQEDCGCVVIEDRTTGAYIVYCYKHAAAPDMYEACVGAMKWWARYQDSFYPSEFTAIVKALAKAEGVENPPHVPGDD